MVLGLLVNLGRTSNETSVSGAFFFFFFIVFLGGTINAACDRNLCKLFTIKKNQGKKKKGSGCFSQEKFKLFSLRYRFL